MQSPILFGFFTASLLLVPAAVAQTQSTLPPGSYVGTTFDPATIASTTSSVQVIDPVKKTATPLKIVGPSTTVPNFPESSSEGPDSVVIESVISLLIGTRATSGSGNIYRVRFGSTAWVGTKLNTSATNIHSVSAIATIGSTIYMCGSAISGSTGSSALLLSMPSSGGAVTTYLDIGKAGATGLGNAMCAVGTTLHYFTFESTTSTSAFSEHWTVDTTATTPKAVKVGALPLSKRLTTSNFAAVQADYDPVEKLLVIAGSYGDILWRTPAGKDIRQYALGTQNIDACAINSNTGDIGIGDRTAKYDEYRCSGTFLADNVVTMPSPVTSVCRLSNLDYLPGTGEYVTYGPGCSMSGSVVPCSSSNSLPFQGNTNFKLVLDSNWSKLAMIAVGGTKIQFDMNIMGAPGCMLFTTVDGLVATKSTLTGFEYGPVTIPKGVPTGTTVYTQWLVLDSINKLGFVVSDGRRLTVR